MLIFQGEEILDKTSKIESSGRNTINGMMCKSGKVYKKDIRKRRVKS